MSVKREAPSRKGTSGLVFVGCLLIALALGLLYGNMATFVLGGLGVGFFFMAVVRVITGQW